MTDTTNGWVVVNIGHPSSGTKYICASTFDYTRKAAIKSFVEGSGNSWRYWRDKYNFRVVRAKSTIEASNP